jgi:hypothetical protein
VQILSETIYPRNEKMHEGGKIAFGEHEHDGYRRWGIWEGRGGMSSNYQHMCWLDTQTGMRGGIFVSRFTHLASSLRPCDSCSIYGGTVSLTVTCIPQKENRSDAGTHVLFMGIQHNQILEAATMHRPLSSDDSLMDVPESEVFLTLLGSRL